MNILKEKGRGVGMHFQLCSESPLRLTMAKCSLVLVERSGRSEAVTGGSKI